MLYYAKEECEQTQLQIRRAAEAGEQLHYDIIV